MKPYSKSFRLVLAALCLALAYLLPFLTGQIPEIGSMLCPMHLPILLCGFLCGPLWGLAVGAVVPLFRSLTLGMPLLFPNAVCMAFELATYSVIAGLLHRAFPRKRGYIYASLLLSMLAGRLVWGVAMAACLGLRGGSFPISAFFAGAVTNAIPGIALQIVFVPILVMLLDRQRILRKP